MKRTHHTYQFTQDTPATTWTIDHNLNLTAPIVDCWILDNGVYTRLVPLEIVSVGTQQVQVTFSAPRAGRALVH